MSNPTQAQALFQHLVQRHVLLKWKTNDRSAPQAVIGGYLLRDGLTVTATHIPGTEASEIAIGVG